MRKELYIFIAFIILIITGCSNGGSIPVMPSEPDMIGEIPAIGNPSDNQGRELIGLWTMNLNPENQEAIITPDRILAQHMNVTPYIPSPIVEVLTFNPMFGLLEVNVTLSNPTLLDGYDVRLIIFTNNNGVMLRNPDNWTNLWDIPGGSQINPFKAFAKVAPGRKFSANSSFAERLQLYMPAGITKVNFAIDACFPENCAEPYSIENFGHFKLKDKAGSSTNAWVDVKDWQDDITNVSLYCPAITGQPLVEFPVRNGNRWNMVLTNETGAPAGDYIGIIVATSGQPLYDVVKITVSETVVAEWTIFYYIYSENLGYIADNINEMEVVGSQDGLLNMVVCWDITDTPDDAILHIQKDPGGLNSTIISPRVEDYGEVIPPTGLDMPDPEQLTKFLKFGIREFPAKKYGFTMLTHGNYGIYYHVPEKSFLDDMGVWQFRDAVLEALSYYDIERLDFVGLESCTMSFIEMANCMRDCAKVVWASEYVMLVYSARYDQVLAQLLQNPTMDEYDFATIFVNNTLQNGGAFVYAGWDSDTARSVCIPAVNVLAQALIDNLGEYRDAITTCRGQSDSWGNECEDYRITDLGYFCQNLIAYDPPLPQDLTDAAQNMLDAIDQAIFVFGKDCSDAGCYCSGTGWQILFTDQYENPDPEYQTKVRDVMQNIGFADATLWDEFLIAYDINDY